MDWYNTLTLVPMRIATATGDAIFDELVIDGRPLGDYLWPGEQNRFTISPLGRPGSSGRSLAAYAADQLLRKRPAPLASGRRPIYVCNQCGDLGCGAVTALIERQGSSIIWRDFGFERDHDPAANVIAPIMPGLMFTFENGAYYALFAPFLTSK